MMFPESSQKPPHGETPERPDDKPTSAFSAALFDISTAVLGVGLIALIIIVGLLYKKTESFDRFSQEKAHVLHDLLTDLEVVQYNVRTEFTPVRKMDGARKIKYEQDLREIFTEMQLFSGAQWKMFWEILYKPVPGTRWNEMKRWRRKEQIEMTLRQKGEFFEKFTPKHWEAFWKIIEENKRFKHVVYDDDFSDEDKMLLQKGRAILIRTPKSSRITYDITGNKKSL